MPIRIALVHDYLNDFGGAERVLRVLADMYPEAPIYTAFAVPGSEGKKAFADRKIHESKWAWLIRRGKLYSPLRFLLPWIWKSLDLSQYDTVITSCSGYIARGFRVGPKTRVIAYCHTPPRWLYGYQTSIDWQKYPLVRAYGTIVNTYLRVFDWESAQPIEVWIANSKNVAGRIEKFYRKEAKVIYPPVELAGVKGIKKGNYYLMVSRLVGAKGLLEAVEAARELELPLKIAGGDAGYLSMKEELEKKKGRTVELLGRVSEEQLAKLYAGAKGFIALAKDEDFGMTVVEASGAGTPVLAYKGGGYLETVVPGKTGVFVESTETVAIKRGLEEMERTKWKDEALREQAGKFSRGKFEANIRKIVGQ